MTDSSEVWIPVVGHEGVYEVSSLGRVRSLDRNAPHKGVGSRRLRGRVLKPQMNGKGYLHVQLCKDGKAKTTLVHRIVLTAFYGQCPHGMEGCHNDGDPTNNRMSNLRWASHASNCLDKRKHGTTPDTRGERNGKAILTKTVVRQIEALLKSGTKSQRQIAALFGISQTHVSSINQRKRWVHLLPTDK